MKKTKPPTFLLALTFLFLFNGRKPFTKHFKNGKENGVRTEWNEDGKKTFQERKIN